MNRKLRMINTDTYEYVNVNPKNKFGADCVVRAIALATDQSWEQTIRELTELGIKMGYVLNDDHVYSKYLEQKGFVQCKEPRDIFNKKMSLSDYISICEGNTGTIVVNAGSHHLSVIINGKVKDIWNCSYNTMHKYWKKK